MKAKALGGLALTAIDIADGLGPGVPEYPGRG